MVPVCSSVMLELVLAVHSYHVFAYPELYRQIVGIPMSTYCAPLVADLFLFCYERNFMTSLSDVKLAEIIDAFKSTSRYLDDLLNIDNTYFKGMVNRTIHLNCGLTKLIPLIPKPHFWICIYLFQTNLFHLKFISAMTLILI